MRLRLLDFSIVSGDEFGAKVISLLGVTKISWIVFFLGGGIFLRVRVSGFTFKGRIDRVFGLHLIGRVGMEALRSSEVRVALVLELLRRQGDIYSSISEILENKLYKNVDDNLLDVMCENG